MYTHTEHCVCSSLLNVSFVYLVFAKCEIYNRRQTNHSSCSFMLDHLISQLQQNREKVFLDLDKVFPFFGPNPYPVDFIRVWDRVYTSYMHCRG